MRDGAHDISDRWLLTAIAVAALLWVGGAGCGSSTSDSDDGSASSPQASVKQNIDPHHPVVQINTSIGVIRVELDAVNSPGTVRSFLNYVNDGFYNGTVFHYVAADKMIIGGGYLASGALKPAGASVRNEAHNGLKNQRGTIAMARNAEAGIDSATSQFFINLADAPQLDHRGEGADEYGYCVFGKVIDGLDVAERISQASSRDQGGDLVQFPDPPVVIKSVRVIK